MRRRTNRGIWVISLLLFLCLHALAQQEGEIVFADGAPPPTDDDRARAKATADRTALLADELQVTATALNAFLLLRNTLASNGPSPKPVSQALSTEIDAWLAAFPNAVIVDTSKPDAVWDLDPKAMQSLIKHTVILSKLVSDEQSNGTNELTDALHTRTARLSLLFDAMLAEHGLLNRRLETYPFSILAKQSPITCEIINAYSLDYKCVPSNGSTPDTSTWKIGTPFVKEQYCTNRNVKSFQNGTDRITAVRHASDADHSLDGALKGTLQRDAHKQNVIGASC
ncbi:hypothetical protein BSFA1_82340 (plasmid) [Burkholderia sp. SFA1]|nr:hypothetical protein BSFA1_82340 [Burkholderia sp. SFA1]